MKAKKKVVIVGGGISGLSAGIYALDNNFDVSIYEKHFLPGGECTGWYRDGMYIDGCAHWIVGTNKNSDFYPLWYHVGAFDENTTIYDSDYLFRYHIDDEIVTIYSDLDKLYEELMRVAPEDKKIIKEMCRHIEAYQYVRVPVNKPLDMMNLFELIAQGFKMIPLLYSYNYSRNQSIEELARKVKSKILSSIINDFLMSNKYNTHSFYYTMHALSKNDGGVPEGGSLNMAKRIANRFKDLGGNLYLNTPVKRIIVENDTATGVELENGEIIKADYVISSTDIHFTYTHLLDEKYMPKPFKKMFEQKDNYLLNSCIYISYKVTNSDNNLFKTDYYRINPIDIGNKKITTMSLRSHAFDSSLNKENSTITSMIYASYETYDYLKTLSKEEYIAYKNRLGEEMRKEIIRLTSLKDEDISLIDVATPLTYERYCNAYKGSYMSFITTKRSRGLMQKNYYRNLKNFVLAGQWLMPPGGLPTAVLTGKHAAIRLAKLNKSHFITKQKKKSKFYLVLRKKHHQKAA